MAEALTLTRVPLDRSQVAILLLALERTNAPGKEEIEKILKRAQRRMDPSIPHGKEA